MWRDYITLADDLLRMETQASMRSAISRAYYGAYHHWLTYARSVTDGPFVAPSHNAHQELIKWFKQRPNAGEVAIGDALQDLRRARNAADYELNAQFDFPYAKLTVANCRKCVALLPDQSSL
jgi:hypothetical protein